MKLFNREPALFLGVIQAVLALVLAFGVDLSAGQTGAVLAVAAAVLALITRQKVTPVDNTVDPNTAG